MTTKLEELLAADEKASPGPWEPLVVGGDANQYRNPSNTLHLNSSAAWAVGPRHNSTIRAKYDALFIAAARASVPEIRLLMERLSAAEKIIRYAEERMTPSFMYCEAENYRKRFNIISWPFPKSPQEGDEK